MESTNQNSRVCVSSILEEVAIRVGSAAKDLVNLDSSFQLAVLKEVQIAIYIVAHSVATSFKSV